MTTERLGVHHDRSYIKLERPALDFMGFAFVGISENGTREAALFLNRDEAIVLRDGLTQMLTDFPEAEG